MASVDRKSLKEFTRKSLLALGSFVSTRLKILAYHGVVEAGPDTYEVTGDTFGRQLDVIQEKGYQVLRLGEAVDRMYAGILERKCIVITFDDAHTSILENAVPHLRRHGFTATIFVPTGSVGGIDTFSGGPQRKSILGWNQLQSLQKEGIDIHSHSVSHRDLTTLASGELEYEIRHSLEELQDRFGTGAYFFAYPFGMINDRVREAVQKTGYRGGVDFGNIISNWRGTDIFQLKREKVVASMTLDDFAKALNVAHDLPRSLRVHPRQQIARLLRS